MIKIAVVPDYNIMGEMAYGIFQHYLPSAKCLGLATGSSPLGLYERIIQGATFHGLSLADKVMTVNLDEYVGLSPDHDQSYHYYMRFNFFDRLPDRPRLIEIPKGEINTPRALEEECQRYNGILDDNPVDIQILGIGPNGHIGFNEPAEDLEEFRNTRTRVVDLSQETIEANARFFKSPDEVPKQAITMGMDDILTAATLILLASGAGKANAIAKAVLGPINPEVPASLLQDHPNCYFIVDQAAINQFVLEAFERQRGRWSPASPSFSSILQFEVFSDSNHKVVLRPLPKWKLEYFSNWLL